ncbi:MAG TPA: hypothetical protein VG096_24135 [Bryobacteraceae bacterium]|jgi:hypothetical protein|nr:hypothetical protein [Bryobacteraceae bacterium]
MEKATLETAERLSEQHLALDRAEQYLAGLESLVHEARISRDPRVVLEALQVIALQAKTIADLKILP